MKLYLAPLQGITITCYRNTFARIFGGIDAYYSPFIATANTKAASPSLFKDLLPERNDSEVKLIPQLLSNNGIDFNLFAAAIVDMGYDEINWNIGCPFPMVTNKKKGSGILPYPDMIKRFLDTVCTDLNYKITVKMRLGLDDPEEGINVIKVLNDYPLNGVIIHARTGLQMYTGKVDLDSFEALNSICKHDVTFNGDIFTLDDFNRFHQRFPSIDSFMLGRGALSDPFLPSTIKGQNVPSVDKMNMIKQFHDDIYNYYKGILSGDKHLLDKMKQFWDYMLVHIDTDGSFTKKIRKCHSSSNYMDVVHQIFTSSQWRDSTYR